MVSVILFSHFSIVGLIVFVSIESLYTFIFCGYCITWPFFNLLDVVFRGSMFSLII